MPRMAIWNKLLELHLRRCNGEAFQAFVNEFFGRIHGDRFVPIRPQGSKGDKGLDGFFAPDGTVYQCYGASNGVSHKPGYVRKKMVTDYEKAQKSGVAMTRWKFTHNMVGGLTTDMLETFNDLVERGKRDGVEVSLFGMEGFRAAMREMREEDRGDILGFMDEADVDRTELQKVLAEMIKDLADRFEPDIDISDRKWNVPEDKLSYNDIPKGWRMRMSSYYNLSIEVQDSFAMFDTDTLTNGLRGLYVQYKHQGLSPNDILYELHSAIMGDVTDASSALLEPAAMAVLATMFEICVIFEENPASTAKESVNDPAH